MQARLFAEGTVPECSTPEWYLQRDRAPHLEQLVHQPRLACAAAMVTDACTRGARSVVDLGAGDGGLLSLVRSLPVDAWGYDLQPSNIDGACNRGVDVRLLDVLTGPVEWADCAVVTEMLEHLVDPHGFVATIAEHCRWVVASSPANETVDSHYAFHLWCWDLDGYREMVEQAGFEVIAHQRAGEFQVLLGTR